MDSEVRGFVDRVVAGDAEALMSLSDVPHDLILDAMAGADLVVDAESVGRVLRDLARRTIDGTAAQRWASFVRRGYIANMRKGGVIKPLMIEYDPRHEEAIAEIVARLDEIGDAVDGEPPNKEEIDLLLLSLGLTGWDE